MYFQQNLLLKYPPQRMGLKPFFHSVTRYRESEEFAL